MVFVLRYQVLCFENINILEFVEYLFKSLASLDNNVDPVTETKCRVSSLTIKLTSVFANDLVY